MANVYAANYVTKTPYEIAPNDVSYLRTQLALTSSSATLEPLKKWVNGVETEGCFNTGSGFVLIEDDQGRREWASFGSKSCDSENITTLNYMRRGLNPLNPSFSSGTGLDFDAGATVRVIDYTIIYEMTAYLDRFNRTTGSGAYDCGQTNQPCHFMGSYTTAQRDAATYVKDGAIIYNSTLGFFQGYATGAWSTLAGSGTTNATEAIAGKLQVGTLDALRNRTQTGSTGAANALTFKWIVKNGSGAGTAGYVLQAGSNGALSPSLGGTGLSNPTQSGVLVGNGNKNSMLQVNGSSGQVLTANTKGTWIARSLTPELMQWSQPTNDKVVPGAGDANFATTHTLEASLNTGAIININASGTGASTGGFFRYGLKLGSTEICSSNQLDSGNTHATWRFDAQLQVMKNGASGLLKANCVTNGNNASTTSGSIVAFNSTTTNTVNVFMRSNGNTYSYLMNLFAFYYRR